MNEATEKLINQFLTSLLKLIRYFKLYPPNHPYIDDMVAEVEESHQDLFAVKDNLKVAIMGGVMFIGKDPVESPSTMLKNLIKMLSNIKVKSFEIPGSADMEELKRFAKLCAGNKEDLLLDDGKGDFNPEKIKEHELRDVKVNEIEVKIGDDDEGGGSGEGVMGDEEALSYLADQMGVEGGGEGGGGGSGLSEDKIMSMVDAILSRATMGEEGATPQKAQRSFEEIGDMLSTQSENIGDFKQNLLKTVFRMPGDVQKNIFGEAYNDEEDIEMDKMLLNLSIKSRANLIRNELRKKDLDINELKSELGEVVEEESEVVELAEIITQEFGLTAENDDEKKECISRLSALVQSGLISKSDIEEGKKMHRRIRGTVLIAEDDAETLRIYQRYLHPAGFETIVYTDGQEALDGIKTHKPDLIVLDLKLPSLHGLDIIYFLRKNKEYRVPVIISSAYPEFQNEFEIRSYPNCEYLTKPIEKENFLEAIERHAPPPPKEEETEEGPKEKSQEEIQREEDMEKARGVQAKILPDSLPDIVGFDIGTFYCSCKEVGGDYFDIVPIDNRHTGFLVADVSGKGVSGAMVTVMVRSIFKLVAPNHLSPRDALIETNKLIADDIKMGMFFTAVYVILDEVEQTINVCCAGHNPALIWRQDKMQAEYMKPSGMALGITTSSVFENALKEEKLTLGQKDLVITYSDGVPEAMSPDYEEYGEERLAKVVSDNINLSCEGIIDSIYESVQDHEDTAPRHDDITIVAFRNIG